MRTSQSALKLLKAFTAVLALIFSTIATTQATRWARSESRIIDGVNVTPQNKYPMIVALQRDGEYFCSGTILNKFYVLTSAKCGRKFQHGKDNYFVVAGIYHLGDPDPRYVQNITAFNAVVHKRFNKERKGSVSNNIAVIRLSTPLIWNDHVAPTNFPPCDWNVEPNKEIKALAVGWGQGRDDSYPYEPARPLQEVEVSLTTTDKCQREWPQYHVTDDEVCTEAPGGSAQCYGDDGAPLFLYDEASDKHMQIGISSWFVQHCSTNHQVKPTGWNKVSKFVYWIEEITRQCGHLRTTESPVARRPDV